MKPALIPFQNIVELSGVEGWLKNDREAVLEVAQPLHKGRCYRIDYSADVAARFGRVECLFDKFLMSVVGVILPAPIFGQQTGYFYAEKSCSSFFLRLRPHTDKFQFKVEGLREIPSQGLWQRAFGRDRYNLLLALGARLICANAEFQQAFRFACAGAATGSIHSWRPAKYYSQLASSTVGAMRDRTAVCLRRDHIRVFDPTDIRGVELQSDQDAYWLVHDGRVAGLLDHSIDCIVQLDREKPDLAVIIPDETFKIDTENEWFAETIPIRASRINYEQFPERFNSIILTPRGRRLLAGDWNSHQYFEFVTFRTVVKRLYQTHPQAIATLSTPILIHKRQTQGEVFIGKQAINNTAVGRSCSVIIPTRNNWKLLKACIDSLQRCEYCVTEIIIVDNGSDANIRARYQQLVQKPARIRILDRAGPFNFSALCNDGASVAQSDVLVFLNDDTAFTETNGLGRLTVWLQDERIGAVGPCLLFPNGRIQHIGIVTGMGGIADHVLNGVARDDPQYTSVLTRPREVSAITGACIAIRAETFQALQGFDAVNLPVECNDVDLCLRLREAGYEIIVDPRVALIHHQSASRGFSLRPFQRYGRERDYFRRRWRDAILDDPFYHPAYSLFSTTPSLDD